MRNIKLLAMILTFCMALTFLGGCSGGASAPTTEEPTTTTTAAPTPTPTPEPTPTPTPPPAIEKWTTDEKLIGTYYRYSTGILTYYVFNDDNTGLIISMLNGVDNNGESCIHTHAVTEFKYSVISEGMIRIVCAPNEKTRGKGKVTYYKDEYNQSQDNSCYFDIKYKFVKLGLELDFMDKSSTLTFSKEL